MRCSAGGVVVDRNRLVDIDPVELRTQAVILEHSRSVLAGAARTLDRLEPRLDDNELSGTVEQAITALSAMASGIGDGLGDLSESVRIQAAQADPAGNTGMEDVETLPPRLQLPTTGPDNPAALHDLAGSLSDAIPPIDRQRTTFLAAAAALVTQLPAEQLPRFVELSSHLGARMVELTHALSSTGRVLLDYAEGLQRQSDPPAEELVTEQSRARTIAADPEPDPFGTVASDSFKDQLLAAPDVAPDVDTATSALAHEVSFLRSRCLQVIRGQVEEWSSAGADDLATSVRLQMARPEPAHECRTEAPDVRDSVIPVPVPQLN